jgi:hypothetical protein
MLKVIEMVESLTLTGTTNGWIPIEGAVPHGIDESRLHQQRKGAGHQIQSVG